MHLPLRLQYLANHHRKKVRVTKLVTELDADLFTVVTDHCAVSLCALIAGSDATDQLIGIVSDYGRAAGGDGLITGRTKRVN